MKKNPLFLIPIIIIQSFLPFLILPQKTHAFSSNTTIYFPSYEKNLQTGETKTLYGSISLALQRTKNKEEETLVYLVPDHLLSTKVIINNSNSQYLSYYPYGSFYIKPQNSNITNLYTSQKLDYKTSLYYYHARYYNPNTAHFISADYAKGANRYSYVVNNPINNTDPTGNVYEGSAYGEGMGQFLTSTYQTTSEKLTAGDLALGGAVVLGTPALITGSATALAYGTPILISQQGWFYLNLASDMYSCASGNAVMCYSAAINPVPVPSSLGRETLAIHRSVVDDINIKYTTEPLGIINRPGHPGHGYPIGGRASAATRSIEIVAKRQRRHGAVLLHEIGHVRSGHTRSHWQNLVKLFRMNGFSWEQSRKLATARIEVQADREGLKIAEQLISQGILPKSSQAFADILYNLNESESYFKKLYFSCKDRIPRWRKLFR